MNQLKNIFSRLKSCRGASIVSFLLLSVMVCQSASGEVTLSQVFDGVNADDEIQTIAFVNIDNFEDDKTFYFLKTENDNIIVGIEDRFYGYDLDSKIVPFNKGKIEGVCLDGNCYDIIFQDANSLILKVDGETSNCVSVNHLRKIADESETVKYVRYSGAGNLKSDVDYILEITIFDYPKPNGEKIKLARIDGGYYKVNDSGTIDMYDYYTSFSDGESTRGKITFDPNGKDMSISYEWGGKKRSDSFSKVSAK